MGLELAEVINIAGKSIRGLECMGEQFVLVTVKMNIFAMHLPHLYPRPYHWRLADGKNPPLDVSIESDSGLLKGITFFWADTRATIITQPFYRIINGYPIFKTERWGDDQYYFDEKGEVYFSLCGNDVYCSFSGMNVDYILNIDKKLSVVFDANNFLTGLILKGLVEKELNILKDAELI